LKISDLLSLYQSEGLIQTIAQKIHTDTTLHLQLKGMKGSMDAILAAVIYQINQQTQLFVLHDKEEAAYFHTDLQNLLGDKKEVFLFPSSYKRPYHFEKTENANILMRAEILNRINNLSPKGELIVTYPEALTEKVINKKSLVKNTLLVKKGDQLDTEFLYEILISYDFEPTEFVYEAGQFAVRGGIVDVFSYAGELPYRIELFGNEIESIRTFNPISQLSVDQLDQINIIPNVQTKLLDERREGFLGFLPKDAKIWIKDYGQTLDVIEKHFQAAEGSFQDVLKKEYGNHHPSSTFRSIWKQGKL